MKFSNIPNAHNFCTIFSLRKIQRFLSNSRVSGIHQSKNSQGSESLYRLISPMGDPNVSIVTAIDSWVKSRNKVDKRVLQRVINELYYYKRYKHALELSVWMGKRLYLSMSPFDAAMRMKLIFKVFGFEKTEDYFNKLPEDMKSFSVYLSLLNCCTMAKSVDKAEHIMQKARDSGYATKPIWYNLMMDLHCKLGNTEKLADLLNEMESIGIRGDSFTFSVLMSAHAAAADSEGMDKVLILMESDPVVLIDWPTYVIAVQSYMKLGLNDRALVLMKKLEGELVKRKEKVFLFTALVGMYADLGKKDELYQLWILFKQVHHVGNKCYMSMIRSLIKLDDIEGAEKIFEEWDSSGLSVDFRIPNCLVESYCTNGLLEKAEDIIAKVISRGGSPLATTWVFLAGGYYKRNQLPQAVEALKKALLLDPPPNTKSMKDWMTSRLAFLESEECSLKKEEFTNLMKLEGISSTTVYNTLCV